MFSFHRFYTFVNALDTSHFLISSLYNTMLRSILASAFVAHANAVWLAGLNIAGCEIGIDTSVSEQ